MSFDDTPPLGLPVHQPDEIEPLVIEKGGGWKWVALAAVVVALGAAAVLVVTLLGGGPEEPELVLVPQVTDFEWQQARTILDDAGFVPVHEGVLRDEGEPGTVFEQDPPPNSRAEVGGFVAIYYVIRPEPAVAPAATGAAESATTTSAPSPSASPASTATPAAGDPQVNTAEPLDPPWIAIVQSPDNEDDARRLYQERYAEDYPDGGYLYSSDFSQMRDGFWVVYLAQFETQAAADAFCRETFGAPPPGRQPDCYSRTTAG